MKKKFGIYLLGALMLTACNNTGGEQQASDTDSTNVVAAEEETAVEETAPAVEITENRLQVLLNSIAYRDENDGDKNFTDDFYTSWTKAVEIPPAGLGDIGGGEFLWYLVCGNDPCETHTVKMKSAEVKGDTAYVKFNIMHPSHSEENDLPHNFKLVLRDGEWVVADYDNNLNTMKNYYSSQLNYLRSSELRETANHILDDPEASEDWKNNVRYEMKEIEEYLKKHK
ncbi:MAG: hypothetical protein MJZ41_08590 [Bacteroidaceae bacterium]|nr:hypothetical protein [Bacteroidaceae bacterium]